MHFHTTGQSENISNSAAKDDLCVRSRRRKQVYDHSPGTGSGVKESITERPILRLEDVFALISGKMATRLVHLLVISPLQL